MLPLQNRSAMQENEFEKRMQQKMEALRWEPGEAVWQNVHAQVGKGNKRKRRFAIILLLLVTFLAGSLWLADLQFHKGPQSKSADNKASKKIATSSSAKTPNEDQQAKDIVPTVASSKINTTDDHSKSLLPEENTGEKNNKNSAVFSSSVKPILRVTNKKNNNNALHHNITISDVVNNQYTNEIAISSKSKKIRKTTKGKAIITTTPAEIGENEEEEKVVSKTNQQQPIIETSTNKQENLKKEIIAISKQPDTISTPKEVIAIMQKSSDKKEKKKGWVKSLLLGAGRSNSSQFNLQKLAQANYDGSTGAIPGNGTTSPVDSLSARNYNPSATKPGFTFSAAVQVAYPLTKKLAVGIGLKYQLITTSIATGKKIDTAIASGSFNSSRGSIYQQGNTNTYTNFYHLLTIPVSFSAQIASIKDKAVTAGIDVNFSRLLSTSALLFNYANGTYYKGSDVFNKTLVGLSGHLQVNLAGKNKKPFYIGPDFYYSLTPQAPSGMYANSHYKSYGITLQKVL